MDAISFVIKVFGLSAVLSVAIKYGAPSLGIPAMSAIALVAVLLPTVVMGLLLGWRSVRRKNA